MKRIWYQILTLILTVSMLACAVACQSEQPPVVEGDPEDQETFAPVEGEDPEKEEEPVPTEIQLSAKYVLIRPEERSDEEVKAVQLLWRALGSIYGEKFSMETDYVGRDEEAENADAFEILVGNTNRSKSKAVYDTLSYNDWSYRVIDQNTIVICGGCPEATYTAACAFLKDLFGYQESEETGEVQTAGAAAVLKIGTVSDYHHQYAVSSFTLGAHELSAYSLVTSNQAEIKEAAQAIVDHFIDLTGVKLPIVSLSTYKKGDGGPAIFLGCANAEGKHLEKKPYSADRYYILSSGDHIILDFKNVDIATTAVNRFLKECTPEVNVGEAVTVSFSAEKPITGLYIPEGTNSLELDTTEITEVAPGVVYEQRLYYDPNGKPVRAYVLTVEKGAATIATSLPKDQEKIGTYATVLDQVIAAANNGKNVVAGINADFFGNTMLGLCVRDRVELHGVKGRPWFGILVDGTPVLGTAEEYGKYEGKLLTGVGGSNVIIDEDYVSHISIHDEFGYTRHPRTAVGITADGSTVLLVVDGRQSKISNGAALADLADILGSFGCIEAINLDGGGSSTFVLVDDNGEFDVKNSPSDGSLRETANGLMVILP